MEKVGSFVGRRVGKECLLSPQAEPSLFLVPKPVPFHSTSSTGYGRSAFQKKAYTEAITKLSPYPQD